MKLPFAAIVLLFVLSSCATLAQLMNPVTTTNAVMDVWKVHGLAGISAFTTVATLMFAVWMAKRYVEIVDRQAQIQTSHLRHLERIGTSLEIIVRNLEMRPCQDPVAVQMMDALRKKRAKEANTPDPFAGVGIETPL